MKKITSGMMIIILSIISFTSVIEISTGEPAIQSRNESDRITGWMIDTVEDQGEISGECSIALDENDLPHISYYDKENNNLWYAFWTGERWERYNVDDGGRGEIDNSIAVDSNNVPHISYFSDYNLKYAKKCGTSWHTEVVDNIGNTGWESSLALDSNDCPHISYFETNDNDLKYAKWNGTVWSIETVDSLGSVGYSSSLVIDSNDNPHISYYDSTNYRLKHARWNESAWINETVDKNGDVGFRTSIDIDSLDHPHICYVDRFNGSLKYSLWDGTDWMIQYVDNKSGIPCSLKLDKNNYPHIVFSTSFKTGYYNQNLTYAKWTGDSWSKEFIETEMRLSGLSIDLDRSGDPHISYVDAYPNWDMKYTRLVRNPTPPQGLSSNRGDGFIRLSWDFPLEDGNSNILRYNIYRGVKIGEEVLIDNISHPTTYYNDTSVINGQKYFYHVTAVNNVGESGASNEISSIPMGLPSSPWKVRVKSGDSYLLITWEEPFDDGGSDIIEYQIYRGDQQNNESYLDKVSSDERSFNDTSVINGQKYFYFISAVNSVGLGERSKRVSSTPFGLPSAPQNIRSISGYGFVEISWEEPLDDGGSEINEYRINRVDPDDKNIVHSVGPSIRSYNDTTVVNGYSYTYHVSAVNHIGEGDISSEVVGNPSSVPSPPMNVRLITGNNFINILWDEPSDDGGLDIINYHIFRGSSPGDMERIETVSPSTSNFNDTNVENGKKYYYHIIVENTRGESEASNDVWCIPLGYPSPPLNVEIISGVDYIRLSWEKPQDNGGSNIIQYGIYRGLTSSDLSLLYTTDQNTSTYNDTSALSGETYHYFITAISYHGEGERSKEVSGSPAMPISQPSPPSNLTISSNNNCIILTWAPPVSSGGSELLEYRIYRGNGSGDMVLIYTVSSSEIRFVDDDVVIGKRYYYSVSAVNTAGESDKSNSVILTLEYQNNGRKGSIMLFIIMAVVIVLFISIVIIAGFIFINKNRSADSEYETVSSIISNTENIDDSDLQINEPIKE